MSKARTTGGKSTHGQPGGVAADLGREVSGWRPTSCGGRRAGRGGVGWPAGAQVRLRAVAKLRPLKSSMVVTGALVLPWTARRSALRCAQTNQRSKRAERTCMEWRIRAT